MKGESLKTRAWVSFATLLFLLSAAPVPPASAGWVSTGSGSATASATSLAPTGTLVSSCGVLRASVKLDWGASPTSWKDGYEVRWGTTSGTYTSAATTSNVTYTTPALGLGTYYFVVRATKGSWRSIDSNQVSRTIVSVLGLGTCL